jgi:hypothetical protein
MKEIWKRIALATTTVALGTSAATVALAVSGGGGAVAAGNKVSFSMVRSTAAVTTGCLPKATADVVIKPKGQVEDMTVTAKHLPANTDFDLFVIQVPNSPFGISWYQGDLETNGKGIATGKFVGRFSIETFAVAPGSAAAPVVFPTDASSNPAFNPIQMYHLGIWFNSPVDAFNAGCQASSSTTTPFNGEHNAGTQVLSTQNFANDQGPLRQVAS